MYNFYYVDELFLFDLEDILVFIFYVGFLYFFRSVWIFFLMFFILYVLLNLYNVDKGS